MYIYKHHRNPETLGDASPQNPVLLSTWRMRTKMFHGFPNKKAWCKNGEATKLWCFIGFYGILWDFMGFTLW